MARGDFKVDILNHQSDNYFGAFNISRERAQELIMLCTTSLSQGGVQSEHMSVLSQYAETKEEIVFLMFKLGELSGLLLSFHQPMAAIKLIADLNEMNEE
jgi:hypothetical protein